MANNTTLRDGNGALFTSESFDMGSGLQRTSTAANLRVANADVATANPVPVAPTVAGAAVSASNPLPVSLNGASISVGTVSTDAQANAAPPVATEGAMVPLSTDLNRNLRVIVENQPAVQPVSGSVSISNLPAVQGVTETNGAPITGATLPAGGVGITGWLSAIWAKLSNPLAVTGAFWQATQPVSLTALPPLPAGTNAIGSITNTGFAATQSGGWNVGIQVGGAAVASNNPLPMFDGFQPPVSATWTTATTANTAATFATSGMDTVIVTLVANASLTGGNVIFEVFDGATWLPIKAPTIIDYTTVGSVNLSANYSKGFQVPVAGFPQFRVRLVSALTGSGASLLVTGVVSSAPDVSLVTVGLDPAQALPAGTNAIGSVSATGSVGTDYSANKPTLPNVGANFAASGPYASYVLIATVPASATRNNVDIENTSGAQVVIVRDDGTAASGTAPNNASVFALAGGAAVGAQGGSWSSTTFKGRLQIYAPSASAQVSVMID